MSVSKNKSRKAKKKIERGNYYEKNKQNRSRYGITHNDIRFIGFDRSISTYAKTPATIVASSTAEKHMSTVNFAVNSCGNRLSRPTARVTTPVTTRHTTRHIKKQTTTTTTADGTTVEVEKSWWDKVCDFFTFW